MISYRNKLVAINTIVSYTRTILSVVLVLFSSRWVLKQLGVVDYGIYNLIGSILLITIFLNNVLSNADARFFALCVGKGDKIEFLKVFNTCLSLHLVMPVIVFIISILLGDYIITNYLVIPTDRIDSALLIFRITVFTSFFTMTTVPFLTLFVAYQNIITYSLLSLLQTFLMFISAFCLRFFSYDKLILYTIFVSAIHLLISILQIILAIKKYECAKIRFRYFFNKKYCRSILKYSVWHLLGDLGHLFRTQGISIIVNLFFGPSGNAALGIANQVSLQASNLTNSMSSAISPEIYRKVGEKNYQGALSLSNNATKIGLILMLIIGIPISLNIEQILKLWLINVPDGASILCLSFIFMFVIEKLTLGQHRYLMAIGKVSLVNILIFIFYCSALLLPFCGFLQLGLLGIGLSCILSMFLSRLSILFCINKYANYNIRLYIKTIIFPFVIILILFVLYYFFMKEIKYKHDSFYYLFLYLVIEIILSLVLCFYLIMQYSERKKILKYIVSKSR